MECPKQKMKFLYLCRTDARFTPILPLYIANHRKQIWGRWHVGMDGKCDARGGTLGPAEAAGYIEECCLTIVYFVWSDHQGTWRWVRRHHSPISTDGDNLRLLRGFHSSLHFSPRSEKRWLGDPAPFACK